MAGLVVLFSFCPGLILAQSSASGVKLRLTFAGDVMAHTVNFNHQPFSTVYEPIKYLLADSDLNFANLEFPVDNSAPYASFPYFNVHSEYPWAAIEAGFNVFSLANNHSADRGPAGIAKTQEAMAELAIRSSRELQRAIIFNGLRPHKEDSPWQMEIRVVNGVKVGFVALAEWVNEVQHTK